MTATDELRRLLDERGVRYEAQREGMLSEAVEWDGPIGTRHSAFVSNENPDRKTGEILYATLFVTPEQAVEATMGRGKCHNTSYRLDESRFHCSECGFGCWVKDVADGRDKLPQYCPRCGREVER